MNINVIIDTSGSMACMAKTYIIRSLIKFCCNISDIHNELCSDISFIYYTIDNSNAPVLFDCKNEIKASGNSELFNIKKLYDDNEKNIMFLTDGRFDPKTVKEFAQNAANYPDICIVPVAIGADTDEYALKDISTCKKIFRSEDIMQAIEIFISKFSSGGSGANGSQEDWDA